MKIMIILLFAVGLGGSIAYVDSRPTWDDTGITALALFLVAAAFGFASPRRAWVWGLALGIWIPLLGILRTGNYGSVLALLFAFAGAMAGMLLRKAASHASA